MADLRLSKGLIAAIVAIVAVVIVLMMVVLAYNGMVSKDQGVQSQWSDVEVAYQRKIDLVPTMFQIVNMTMDFEYNLYVNVTNARNVWQNLSGNTADKMNASVQLDVAFAAFVNAVHEAYPNPTATPAAILTFMDQYESTTNQIASERKFYNDAVREYNTAIRKFPNVLFASAFGFEKALYYDQDNPVFD